MLKDEDRYWIAIAFPVLFCIATSRIDLVGWEFWGREPSEKFPQVFRFVALIMRPLDYAGFFLILIFMPIILLLKVIPGISENFAIYQYQYLIFSLYILFRFRRRHDQVEFTDCLIGIAIIYFVALYVRLRVKGSSDGQAGVALFAGLNAAFLMAVLAMEAIGFARRRLW